MSSCISFDMVKGRFSCMATENEVCEGQACKFYRTQVEQKQSMANVHERLRSLTDEEQTKIADKYYDGKMPWNT